MRTVFMKSVSATSLAACLLMGLNQAASGAVVDTFNRADGTALGSPEVGGTTYVERATNSAPAAGIRDVALISNNRLVITGQASTDPSVTPSPSTYYKAPGLVYLNGYDSADAAVSMDVAFDNLNNAPDAASRAATSYAVMFRFAPGAVFTTASGSAAGYGLLGAEFLPNGGVLIREYRQTGALATIYSGNPFKSDAANDWKFTPGSLGTTLGGQPFDVNNNGILELGESFRLSMAVSGNTITMSINGQTIVTRDTLTYSTGPSANGVAIYKNLISSSFENPSNVYIDNLDVTPVPEPAALSLLGAGALLALRRRRA